MGSTLDRLYKIALKADREESAVGFLKQGISVDIIASVLKIPKKRILELQKEMRVGA